jgi:hypothetical protein
MSEVAQLLDDAAAASLQVNDFFRRASDRVKGS